MQLADTEYMRKTRDAGRRAVTLALVLVALVMTANIGAQESAMESTWQDRLDEASALTRGVVVDGEPYVNTAATYSPDGRRVFSANTAIDFPVLLSEAAWDDRLTDMQYYVLREDGTERAFSNPMHADKRRGVYYSAATGQPLFHSDDKYDSRTGWPSFTKPISPDAVAYFWDNTLFSRRIEVVDSLSGSHIGHVFNDGPEPTNQRYCMNAAALIFVPEGEDPPMLATP